MRDLASFLLGRSPSTTASSARRPGRRAVRWAVPPVALGLAALLAVAAPAALTPRPVGTGAQQHDTVEAAIDSLLAAQVTRSGAIPGAAVAVIRGDRVLMVRGYGHDSTGAPVTGRSLFRIASLSKSFTALAVMQLVDEGLLDLDASVQDLLPEFQLADPRADQVTVRHLLDHTSGLSDAVVPELSRPQPTTSSDATTALRSARLASTPGTSWSYHNPNYQVAARLVEVISGEPFGQYLRRHVLEPAQMLSTSSTDTDDQPVPGLSDGHVNAYGRAVRAPGLGTFTVGDGGLVSSAADMARWLIVNAQGGRTADGTRLVSRRGMRLLHTSSAPEGGYALGWDTDGRVGAPTRLEHSGSLHTFTSEQALWPASGYGVVLLFNSGSPMLLDQTAIVHAVFDIVEGAAPPASVSLPAEGLDTALGLMTLTAVVLGACGVARAGRWARRRRGAPLRTVLGLLPTAGVLAVGAAFPVLAEHWVGRDLSWRAAAYAWPALVVFVLAALTAAAATLVVRTWRLCRTDVRQPPGAAATERTDVIPAVWPGRAVPVSTRLDGR